MTLDPSIALGFRGLQLNDPMEQAGRAMALSQMGVQNQFMQQKMDESNRLSALAASRQKAFAASNGDPNKFLSSLAAAGDIEGAQAYQEHLLKLQKDAGDIRSKQIKDAGDMQKLRGEVAQFIASGGTVGHVQRGMEILNSYGDEQGVRYLTDGLQQVPNPTPEQVRSYVAPFVQSNLTAEQFTMPKFEDIGGAKVNVNPNVQVAPLSKTQTPESIASNAVAREGHQVTMRGQNMADQRAREGHAITMRGQDLTNARAAEKNKIDATQPKLTESQGKAQFYGTRAKAAHDILSDLQGKYSPMAVNAKMGAADIPVLGGIAGPIANSMLTSNDQRAEQAQRDFVNAILRQESGAVISEPEFKNAQKQYFPQPGDSKAVLKQKKENRERAIKGLDVMSGPAGGFSKQPSPAPSGGVKFLGFE